MSLQDEIAAWDGKAVDEIAEVYRGHHEQPGFIGRVVGLLEFPDGEVGASWLLKAWLEAGGALTARQTKQFLRGLGGLERWEARLHALQCLPAVTIAPGERDGVEAFLRRTLADRNKFVRAWSYNGFHELARQHPEYRGEAELLLDTGLVDEAPSVKARIRNIRKLGF